MVKEPIHYADEDFNPKEVDVMMAKELNKLAFSSRENINEEIHGVCCLAPEETPEMLDVALQKLSEAVDKIPSADKQAYLQSQRLFPGNSYVNDRNFPLMFLRCELFNVQRAAMRMVRHLDFVLEIFDNNKKLLQRPIRLTDLGSRAMKLLRSGCLQLLPIRDSAGRRVFVVSTFKSEYEVVDRLQLYFYFQTVLSEDVDNQRTGFVSLALPGENSQKIRKLPCRKDRYKLARFILSAPVRYCAIHCCYPDTPIFRLIKAAYSLGMHTSDSTKFRLKFHTGTQTETRYQLMSYGIPVEQLPITNSGKVKSGSLQQWLNARTIIEKQRLESGAVLIEVAITNIVECPRLNDVAIRPGKSYLCHPGNVSFKELLEKYVDDHFAANRKGKDIISWTIIEEIESSHGRFLEWDNKAGLWIENVDRNSIRARIPIYFRDHKRNTRGKRKQRKKSPAIAPCRPIDKTRSSYIPNAFDKRRKITGDEFSECDLQR
eukprot:CAMPEP_0116086738 /NCGR_PEP_ID=MMETSP0327-20121206/5009_1 /TAXON_ID=44447 /ORGANISM="Pseudo-nitzschia delicatissima, Strain B596" /LENGTH=487 /DNA_ID=CAMNT_0003577797 /DNA_START=127 /DNA_END=1586 /DNA_ORIENTATION=-